MARLFALIALPFFASFTIAAEPRTEFRGVWVASVANIDWPSKPGLSADVQQKELTAMLDRFAALNFNAIVLQIRPMCDALYASDLEPWSEFLTGTSGRSVGRVRMPAW